MKHIPGIDMSTGSLGQGFSAANGIALAGKIDKKITAFTRYSATVKVKRDRYGKPLCSALIISSTIFAQ